MWLSTRISWLRKFCLKTRRVSSLFQTISEPLTRPLCVCRYLSGSKFQISPSSRKTKLICILVFDRRRRDPLWKLTEKLSGESKITQKAVNLFYGQIDKLIDKRLQAMENGYKPDPDAGVDLLDLFIQSTNDRYKLSGMVFAFLSAGRKLLFTPPQTLLICE